MTAPGLTWVQIAGLLDDIRAEVAVLGEYVRPVVVVSSGYYDEANLGPTLAAAVVSFVSQEILAMRPDLVLLHLDYEVLPLEFWRYVPFESSPRWHHVLFHRNDEGLLGSGLHLSRAGYIERVLSLMRQYPVEMACRVGPDPSE